MAINCFKGTIERSFIKNNTWIKFCEDKQGLMQGPFEKYEHITLRIKGFYRNSKMYGRLERYNERGSLVEKSEYNTYGKLHGKLERYENGKIVAETYWNNGKPEGKAKIHSAKGTIISEYISGEKIGKETLDNRVVRNYGGSRRLSVGLNSLERGGESTQGLNFRFYQNFLRFGQGYRLNLEVGVDIIKELNEGIQSLPGLSLSLSRLLFDHEIKLIIGTKELSVLGFQREVGISYRYIGVFNIAGLDEFQIPEIKISKIEDLKRFEVNLIFEIN